MVSEVTAALGQIINSTMSLLMTRCYRLVQVAKHLANTYGDQAVKVAKLAKQTGKSWPVIGKRLHEDYPYIEAEVGDTGWYDHDDTFGNLAGDVMQFC